MALATPEVEDEKSSDGGVNSNYSGMSSYEAQSTKGAKAADIVILNLFQNLSQNPIRP